MKSFGTTLAFAGAASAAAIQARAAPEAQCCFGINVNGAVAGSVGQLGDGQNRVGSGFGGAQFCYYPDTTSIVDASGRGCIATSPTSQYQCDAGLTATTATSGITLASNGSIEHGGSAVWYECDSGNGFNIYQVSPGAAGTKCSQITLTVAGGNCSAPASSSSASSTKPASSSSASVSSASASKASSSSASASSVSASKSSSSVVSTSIATSTVVSTSTKPASTSTASVASPTTFTSATTQKTTQTVATPTTLTSAITQKTTQTVASPTTITPPVSVSTQVSVESCVPSTITAQASTVTVTVTAPAAPPATVTVQPSCAPCASGPAPSGPAPSGPVSSAPGPSVPAPTGPVPAQSTTYACNPAHSYPNGASCISTAGSLTLVTPSATTSAPAETYACNPAHSYPNGASCISTAGTLSLVTPSSAPASTRNSVSTATLTSTIQSTATIPASSAQGSTTAPASSPASGTPSNMSPGSTKATPPAPAATVCTKPNVNGQYGCPEQCPLDLSTGPFEYPHLIQINGQNGYFGEVNATAKTDFTFDIPASLAGKTCNAYFAIPTKSQLVTADYSLSTTQGAQVYLSSGGKQVSAFSPVAGQNVLVSSGPCAAGKAVTYEMTADNSIDFRWFQDYNACALGLFVVPS